MAMIVSLATSTPPDRWEFIWASYAAYLVIFVALIVTPIIRREKIKARLKHYYKRKSLLEENSAKE